MANMNSLIEGNRSIILKKQQQQTSNKTPDQYFKKVEKARIFFIEQAALVQNRLCFTFLCVAKYRLYQTSIRHVAYLCIIDACLQSNASKTKLASPHTISVCRSLFQFCSIIFTILCGGENCTIL